MGQAKAYGRVISAAVHIQFLSRVGDNENVENNKQIQKLSHFCHFWHKVVSA